MASQQDAPKFPLGRVVATPGALGALTAEEIRQALSRHASGDWGDVDEHDRRENEFSLGKMLRIVSAYRAEAGTKFWVITEADRSLTTVLLPDEY